MSSSNDSLLFTIIKKFTGSFFSVLGFFIALFLFFALIGLSFKGSTTNIGDFLTMKVHTDKDGVSAPLGKKNPIILQINIEGPIGRTKGSTNTQEVIEKTLRQPALHGISKDRIKGILLKINSPGGSAAESEEIYQDIMAYKKELGVPAHTWIGDVCASGGYYIAMASDYISAQPISIIGSVGVVYGPRFNLYNLMKKHGIESTTLTAGKSKMHFPMFSEMPKGSPPPYQDFVVIMENIYNRFLDIVVDARGAHGLTRDKLLKEYGAQVYGPRDAMHNGYINAADVRYKEAVQYLAESVSINESSYQVVSFHHLPSPLEAIRSSIESKFSFFFGGNDNSYVPYSLEADLTNPIS